MNIILKLLINTLLLLGIAIEPITGFRVAVRKLQFQASLVICSLTNSFKGYQQPETKQNAYQIALRSSTKVPSIILVNPFLDQNIGSVARAMLNFGLTDLRIVDPRCDHKSENCRYLKTEIDDFNQHFYVSIK